MTTEEFSNEFDALMQTYSNTMQFGSADKIALDEYEKSVFLTKAQEDLIIDLYNGKNPFRDSFEKTEEIRRYLSNLVKTYTTSNKEPNFIGLSDDSIFFKLPDDVWFITYESVKLKNDETQCINNNEIIVVPITQDEYHRVKRNPFRRDNNRRVIRLDVDKNTVEIVSKYKVDTYLVRYLSKPSPIILSKLPDNLSINGVVEKTECELNPVMHRTILERAVELAIRSKVPHIGKE